jgi:para-nitrobenzyl esterase
MHTKVIFALVALSGALLLSAAPPNPGPVVITDHGKVRGAVAAGIASFRGIPYAAPPVGELRWQPPRPPFAWHDVRDATAFGSACPQVDSGVFYTPGTTEDCLYLNVFAPAGGPGTSARRAVMVWFPGGGLFGGASNDYDPSALVTTGDVVFVSVNYRVGVLGFLALPALDAEKHDIGNYGLMDQQLALAWLQQNIAAFGGDPRNVTIFGQSAGGVSTLAHIASPGSAHLFAKAIVESAGTPSLLRTLTPLARAETNGTRFAAAAGCTENVMTCLRALTPAQIVAAQTGNLTGLIGGVKTLPIPFRAAFETGNFNHVPIIAGNTRDEWRWILAQTEITSQTPLTPEKYPQALAAFYGPAVAPAVLTEYPVAAYPNTSEALGAAETDYYIACSSLRLDQWMSPFVPMYTYEFDDVAAPMYMAPVSFPYGAAHTAELQFIFPNYHGARGTVHALSLPERALSAQMVRYWTNFARTGNPNDPTLPTWPRFASSTDMLSFRLPKPVTFTTFADQHHCAFWDRESQY